MENMPPEPELTFYLGYWTLIQNSDVRLDEVRLKMGRLGYCGLLQVFNDSSAEEPPDIVA